jgi:hypothetical protein
MTVQIHKENMPETVAIPSWFKAVAITALIWNLLGVLAFALQMMITPEILAGLPAAERELYVNIPLWVTISFAVAVFSGSFGSLFLLLKKPLATPLLILSLIGVFVQNFHSFFMSNALEVNGPVGIIMPAVVILFGIYLIILSKKAQSHGWFS